MENLHAARERFAQLGKKQEVGGPGEKKATRAAIVIHRDFDGTQQCGRKLHFIYCHRIRESPNKPSGILLRRSQEIFIVKAHIGSRQGSDQCRLPALPGTEQANNRGFAQCPDKFCGKMARQKVRGFHCVHVRQYMPSICGVSSRPFADFH